MSRNILNTTVLRSGARAAIAIATLAVAAAPAGAQAALGTPFIGKNLFSFHTAQNTRSGGLDLAATVGASRAMAGIPNISVAASTGVGLMAWSDDDARTRRMQMQHSGECRRIVRHTPRGRDAVALRDGDAGPLRPAHLAR